jgi:DNA-binding MltR family transcriptional regulator
MSSKRNKVREKTTLQSQDIQGFLQEFQKESDRATAVLGAALLDAKVLQLLTAFLVDDKKQVESLLDVEQPLGSFGARIRMAYCLGLVTKSLFEILTTIKGIRNTFAHQLHGLSFQSPHIAKECSKLGRIRNAPEWIQKSSRSSFLSATLSAEGELSAMTVSIQASERRCKIPKWEILASTQKVPR